MKRLIINADDFGLSKGINRGIIKAYQEGILTSASLIVNMPGFEDAISLIRRNPGLTVGIHLNIIRGEPVLPSFKLPSFTIGRCFLRSPLKILGVIYSGKLSLKELEIECRAQIEKLLQRGISITHIDSEKHLHLINPIFAVITKIAREYGISKIRCINEISLFDQDTANLSFIFRRQFYNRLFLNMTSAQNRLLVQRYHLKTADYFCGVGGMTRLKYERALLNLKNGTTEIMCHPGYIEDEWQNYPLSREKYYLNVNREQELNALIDQRLKELIRRLNIELISFKEL